ATGSLFNSSSKNASTDDPQPSSDAGYKDDEGVSKERGIDNQEKPEKSTQDVNTASTIVNTEVDMRNISNTYLVPSTLNTRIHKDHSLDHVIGDVQSGVLTRRMTKATNDQGFISAVYIGKAHEHLHICFFLVSYLRNKKDEDGIVVRNNAGLVAQGYTQEEGIDYDEVFAPVSRIEAIRLFLAYPSFKNFVVYQMDMKSAFMYGKIKEEVYVCQHPWFEDPKFPNKVYNVVKVLYGLHPAPRACQDKYVVEILKKFGFSTVKTASTPMETSKPLLKDAKAKDVHLYRSMISSLIYLTASRLDMMFVVCACERFQVTPKVLHLHAVKRIFRYLKGQPKLGLWYPKDSPFDLEAYTNIDYAGASLDKKSTTRGCQILGSRLISWQCKKQTVVANSTTEAEYVAAASCCGQVLRIQNQILDYGYNFMNTKIFIDNESTNCIVKNPMFHSKTKHIEIRHHFIRDSNKKKLIQMIKIQTDQNVADLLTKAFDVWRFEYLAYTYYCQLKVNAARYIFDHMVKNLEGGVKFLMFPRFVQVFLDSQVEGMLKHKEIYVTPSHTKKIFDDMKRQGKDFSGKVTPLFETMMKQKSKKPKKRINEVPQLSDSTNDVADGYVTTTSNDQLLVLEKKANKKSHKLKRLYKIGSSTRVESSEDAGRNDQDRFDTSVLDDEEVVAIEKEVSTACEVVTTVSVKVSTTAITPQVSMEEIILAKALIDIKTSKPKAKGIVMQDPSETPTPTPIVSTQQPSKAKDKGKAKMIEPEKPLKKKDQIMFDEEVAKNLKAQLQAELEEEERIARQKEEEANIAVIKSWENTQAMIDADYQMAQKLQTEEQEQLSIEGKSNSKRAGRKLEQEDDKRQRIEEENESAKLKKCLEIVPDDEDDVTIEATPLSSKSPTIVDYTIYKEGRKSFFKIIRADDNIWKYQQGLAKDNIQNMVYYLLVEKMYPLTRNTPHQMWNDVRLQIDYKVDMAYDLLRLIRRQISKCYVLNKMFGYILLIKTMLLIKKLKDSEGEHQV
nr:putative reverse transcriptase, RNA-dependent DNA polymerase [Tanacetum cinerariifolium]